MKPKFLTASTEEIKIVHNGTKQKEKKKANSLAAKTNSCRKNCPTHPLLSNTGISYAMKILHDFIVKSTVRTANSD